VLSIDVKLLPPAPIESELIVMSQGEAVMDLDLWEKPIGVAMKQGNTRILNRLLSPDVWKLLYPEHKHC
jgi:hypothetical protein